MFSANNPPSLPSVDSADRQPAVRHNCEHQVAQPFSFYVVLMPKIKAIVMFEVLQSRRSERAPNRALSLLNQEKTLVGASL